MNLRWRIREPDGPQSWVECDGSLCMGKEAGAGGGGWLHLKVETDVNGSLTDIDEETHQLTNECLATAAEEEETWKLYEASISRYHSQVDTFGENGPL